MVKASNEVHNHVQKETSPKVQYYFGPSGCGKSTRIQEDLIERAIREPERRFVYIVPDQFTLETQKELIVRHPAKGFMNIDILSFSRLAHKLFEEVGVPERLALDDTGKNLIIRRVAKALENELPTLGTSLSKIGYIHEAKSVISEFMQYGLAPKDVDVLIEKATNKLALKAKLIDIKKVYEGFESYIADRYITKEEKLEQLASCIPRSRELKECIVILDGFTGFTPVQNKVIESLMEVCGEMWLSITIDKMHYERGQTENNLFSLSTRTLVSFEKMRKQVNAVRLPDVLMFDCSKKRYADNEVLAHLEKNIFRSPSIPFDGEVDDKISIIVEDNPRRELEHVCRSIAGKIRDNDYAYRDIAIITGDIERYAPFAEETFRLYEIPGFVDASKKLVHNPFTEYIRSGLEAISNNFSYDSMIHFLRSGLTGIDAREVDILDNYALAVGVRGFKRWNNKFAKYPKYMKESVDGKLSVTDKSVKMLDGVDATRQKAMKVLEPLTKLLALKKVTFADVTRALYDFINTNDIVGKLNEYAERFGKEGDFVRQREYSQIYGKFIELLEQIYSLMSDDEVTIASYVEILEAGLSEIKIGVMPEGCDYVSLGDIERTRLSNKKVVYFVGVNDGVIPKASGSGGLISDLDREFLSDEDIELAPSPRQKMYIQRLYLYMNMTKPMDSLVLSYSRNNSNGEAIRPAYLIELMKKLFPGISEIAEKESIYSKLITKGASKECLAMLLREYAAKKLSEEDEAILKRLYSVLKEERLLEGAFYRHEESRLSKRVVEALYGKEIRNSVSTLEAYANCAYSHYMKYGLRLLEREEYGFTTLDAGNIYHEVLEEFGNRLDSLNMKWSDIDEAHAEEILQELITDITAKYGEAVLYKDERTKYQIKRMLRILKRNILGIGYHLKKGRFVPKAYEVNFRRIVNFGVIGEEISGIEKMLIHGKIDRIDICEDEDKLYVKVIDYKSGNKAVDLINVYHGLQLQLAVYLNETVRKEAGNTTKTVIPAAMLYYRVHDPIVAVEGELDEQAAESVLRDELRVSGLLPDNDHIIQMLDMDFEDTSDVLRIKKKTRGVKAGEPPYTKESGVLSPEDFKTVLDYADFKTIKLSEEMIQGNAEPKPCGAEACGYCAFRSICDFNPEIEGYSRNVLVDGKNEDILKLMKKEMGLLADESEAETDGAGNAEE